MPDQDNNGNEEMLNTIRVLKIALADAIRRPMGVIPESAEGLVTHYELEQAEVRRISKNVPIR